MSEVQKYRVSQQETLVAFASQAKSGFDAPSEDSVYKPLREQRLKRLDSKSVSDTIFAREKEANRVSCTKEELQQFVNGFSNLSISLLQPYIQFEKHSEKHNRDLFLNFNEANLASFRRFLDGALNGTGSIGFESRRTPGGFGIKQMDMEYLANQKSGYSFNHYKLELEIFCGSLEDMITNIGDSSFPYTILDVLISFPEDIKKMLDDIQSGASGGELSSAFKTTMEMGYNIQDSEKDVKKQMESTKLQKRAANVLYQGSKPVPLSKGHSVFTPLEKKNYSEQMKILIQQNGAKGYTAEMKIEELLKKLKFRICLTPYKWIVDITNKGNITLKISYNGYDSMISSKMSSNVMALVSEIKEYQRTVAMRRKVRVATTLSSREEIAKDKKQAEKDKKQAAVASKETLEGLQRILLQRPYQRLGSLGRSFEMLVDYTALEMEKGGAAGVETAQNAQEIGLMYKLRTMRDDFIESRSVESVRSSFKKLFKGLRITPKNVWRPESDFDDIDVRYGFLEGSRLTDGGTEYETQTRTESDGKTIFEYQVQVAREIEVSTIPYFYLGDLLVFLSAMVSKNLIDSGEYKKGSYLEFVTDSLVLPDPWIENSEITINISELPISWDLFMEWWEERIKARKNLIYKLEEFFQEFFGHFIQKLFQPTDMTGTASVVIGCHVLEFEIAPDSPAKRVSYYLYQVKADKEPVVKFYIGNARGMMKDVQFEKVDDQYLSSAYMQMAEEGSVPDNNLQFQRAIYNCSLTLFGNSIFQPGMTVEVVPSIVGVPFSDTATMRNIYDLGIGGLFSVTATKVSLRQGNFETVLTTRWLSKPVMNVESWVPSGEYQEFWNADLDNNPVVGSEVDAGTQQYVEIDPNREFLLH